MHGTQILSDPAGTVFVYRLGDGLPVRAGRLESDRLGQEDCFSRSLDVRGDVAVVGARCEVGGGAAYVYRFDGTAWVREAKLGVASVAGPVQPLGDFGTGVALGDDLVVVGAPVTPNPSNPAGDRLSGAAFVFERVGGQWSHTATLVNSDTDGQRNELFGSTVATVGEAGVDAILVGAPQGIAPGASAQSGAVYVFERQGRQWVQQRRIGEPSTRLNDSFGQRVVWSGGGGLVSSNSAAYPLDRTGDAWTLGPALPLPEGRTEGAARFGQTAVVVVPSRPPYTEQDVYRFTLGGPAVTTTVTPFPASPYSTSELVSLTGQALFYGRATLDAASDYVLIQRTGATADEPAPPLRPSRLTLAPNPTTGTTRVRFETSESGPARLAVVDALGRRIAERDLGVLAAGPHDVVLDVGALPAGVYAVQVDTPDGRAVRRLVRP